MRFILAVLILLSLTAVADAQCPGGVCPPQMMQMRPPTFTYRSPVYTYSYPIESVQQQFATEPVVVASPPQTVVVRYGFRPVRTWFAFRHVR